MKFLKICIIACSLGIFNTACRNNENCATTNTDSTASTVTTTSATDGTNAAATSTVDTPAGTNMESSNKPSTHKGVEVIYVDSTTHRRRNDTAKGPDLKASKKREGNYTNGTGRDYPGGQ